MLKQFLKLGLIIFSNLFAFLALGNILDTVFQTKHLFLFIFLVLSILPLTIILMFWVGSVNKELTKISPKDTKHDGK